MNNATIKRIFSWAAGIAIVVLILFGAYRYAQSAKQEKINYSELLGKFDRDEVAAFTLNTSSGALQYWNWEQVEPDKKTGIMKPKKDEENKFAKQTVNVALFVEDLDAQLREHNKKYAKQPGKQVNYHYVDGSGTSWLVQLLPMVLIGGMVVIFGVVMMRRMNQTMTSENNRSMSFGKARLRQQSKDDKRK
ncbi:MAG: ATP-dependent metallopeptidase FtsH/Yme1/Tma family protein, partial [Oscillospiraceae bacterium]|nr:ATP-dependent metallopeptidase FtsH/Yme1/Tma family protein [Oscillospiraceae bacterium]